MNIINRRYGTSVKVFRHNSWTARDESTIIAVVREYLENIGYDPEDLFVLLQAISPFTRINELCCLY